MTSRLRLAYAHFPNFRDPSPNLILNLQHTVEAFNPLPILFRKLNAGTQTSANWAECAVKDTRRTDLIEVYCEGAGSRWHCEETAQDTLTYYAYIMSPTHNNFVARRKPSH